MRRSSTTSAESICAIDDGAIQAVLVRLGIGPLDGEREIRAKIMRVQTDSTAVIEPKDAMAASVLELYIALAEPEARAVTLREYQTCTIGNQELKARVVDLVLHALGEEQVDDRGSVDALSEPALVSAR